MATITKSADAPAGVENFSVGNVDFTLSTSSPKFVTDDQSVIGNARVNAWLDVEYDKPVADPDAAPVDKNDPHSNPEADHLSAQASPAAKAAAAANQAAISDTVTGEQSVSAGSPPVAQAVADSLSIIGVPDKAEVPFAETPSATPPVEPVSSKTEDSPAVATTTSSSPGSQPDTTPAATPAASSSSSATPTTGATS
jgi:hypothetical protein